ncbi:YebC/PmpR family DNA-binding transcriptional regulator [Teredinibacter turnerae]|uniref:YebC/PmpR family DNA-binding transcriptional regulator n=1 Tax=Teredinibacter turnerae TaxID=2426 RepID=UPI0003682EF5|nr:YebC/PmpR family DNA-binding transcriptional regulator [Teredinibacter turnerae]
MGRTYENRKASMAKTGAMKTKLYSRYGKEIYVCAKNGGAEVDSNLSLRRLIEKAKKEQVPSHVIDKALDKARGGGGEDFVTVRFEGFGPGNCMVIVDCLTDNNNRTFGDVRTCFNKGKAKLGGQGAVAHMFDHRAIFSFAYDDEERVLEALMEEDVDVADIENDDGIITVIAPQTEFFKTKTALTNAFGDVNFEVEEITFVPQTYAEIEGDDKEQMEKFLDLLNDCDDVQEVYHNAIM